MNFLFPALHIRLEMSNILTRLSHPRYMHPAHICQELDRLLARLGDWTEGGSGRSGPTFIDLISFIYIPDITARILRRCWCTADIQKSCGGGSEGLPS